MTECHIVKWLFLCLSFKPPGSCRPQTGPILAPWTLLSGTLFLVIVLYGTQQPYSFAYYDSGLWVTKHMLFIGDKLISKYVNLCNGYHFDSGWSNIQIINQVAPSYFSVIAIHNSLNIKRLFVTVQRVHMLIQWHIIYLRIRCLCNFLILTNIQQICHIKKIKISFDYNSCSLLKVYILWLCMTGFILGYP